ncbi:MAG: phosphatase PAP2 family protein [Psychroflexus sp.]
MELPPLTHNYFSSSPKKELFYRRTFYFTIILSSLVLYFFWQPLRNTSFTYSLVSIGVGNPTIRIFFRFVTILGSEGFFLILFSIIYWSINKSLGFWGLLLMPLSIFVTSEIPKDILKLPRPDVSGVTVTTYTFPSGHASGAASVWGYLAVRLKKRWFWIFSLIIIALVALSRTMLGYHFLGDVLGGIITGTAFLALFLWVGTILFENNWQEKIPHSLIMFVSLAIPLAMSYIPATYAPSLMGYVAGAGFGFLLQKEKLSFLTQGTCKQHVARTIIGTTIILGMIPGLNLVLPQGVHMLTFVQYALTTFWTTYLAPLLFLKLHLTYRL